MNSVESLKSAWVFDKKGTLKESKNAGTARTAKVLAAAKEALSCAPVILEQGEKLKRIACTYFPKHSCERQPGMADNSDRKWGHHRHVKIRKLILYHFACHKNKFACHNLFS